MHAPKGIPATLTHEGRTLHLVDIQCYDIGPVYRAFQGNTYQEHEWRCTYASNPDDTVREHLFTRRHWRVQCDWTNCGQPGCWHAPAPD